MESESDMSKRRQVIDAARRDAKTFAKEFPGQQLKGDWDAAAWVETVRALKLTDDQAEELWPIYQDALVTAIDAKLMYVRYVGTKICYTILATGGFITEDVEGTSDDIIAICDAGGGTMSVTDAARWLAAEADA